MTRTQRLERMMADLGWLADDSGIEIEGQLRDAIGELRGLIDGEIGW